MTLSTVTGIEGEAGNFTVGIRKAPRYVDMEKCIACGLCSEKCPAKQPDEFNENLNQRKAIYVPYPQAVPLKYAIDDSRCIYFIKNGKCKACEKFCPTGAIKFDEKPEDLTLNVGAVIVTAGYQPFDPSRFDNYQHSRYPNVVTSMEFERILAAGGPTTGHVSRPSDFQAKKPANPRDPRKIAWLQCVGSRDLNRCDNQYCSSVCCMYAIKEAIIAKEHIGPDFEPTIFFMDMRTHGKDFEKYYNRAKDQGVRFIRSRVHTILQKQEQDVLQLSYVTEDGTKVDENFDMVVLSVGMEAADSAIELTEKLGIKLNSQRFVETSDVAPVVSSRPGIYVAGVLQGPKDIPQAVVEASAAACSAGICLATARGSLVKDKVFPAETDLGQTAPRVGVFVCNCGVNIGGIADVPAVVEFAKGLPNVAHVQENLFSCSQDTQDKMVEIIREKQLNRIVVAACTPRTHEPLFQETIRNAGLNAYLFEMANIRNQCTWVHSATKDEATAKAKDLVRMAVARATLLEAIPELSVDVQKNALVVGGGVAGMTAALSLAEQGFAAMIVEKSNTLGGAALDAKQTFHGESIPDFVSKLVQKVTDHPALEVCLQTEISDAGGFVGNFETTLSTAGATRSVTHGATIIATGGQAAGTTEYLYGEHPAVTRWHELEKNPERLAAANTVVFIQCVGSRDDQRPYCSRICCTGTIMQALKVKKDNPEASVFVLYRDIRTFGERELLYKQAREQGVLFVRYSLDNKPTVEADGDGLRITVFDPILQQEIQIAADLLNLATAIVPHDNAALASMYKLPLNAENFFMEAHAKLRPVDCASDGIFICGLAHYPKSLDESIAQAQAAAGRAATVLARNAIAVSPLVSRVDVEGCIGCGLCADVCPFGAISLVEVEGKGLRAENIPASCKGCGLCAASCPQRTIDMLHFRDEQIEAAVCAAF